MLALVALGCASDVPHDPPGAPCADLRGARVCWSAACAEGVCVRAREAPPRAVATRFECAGGRCSQREPRRPDDGEWECVELDGAVLCRGGVPAAAVVPGPPDPGWICTEGPSASERSAAPRPPTGGAGSELRGSRHCVDLAPDRPDGPDRPEDGAWTCHWEDARRGPRTCERSDRAALGDPCGDARACPLSLRCAAGLCVPRAPPRPECWIDRDCGGGRCVIGTCEAPR